MRCVKTAPLRTLLVLCAALLATLCLASPASAFGGTTNGLNWIEDGTSVTINGCAQACSATVTIPATIDIGGSTILPVTSIGEYAFYGATSLQGITIPNSVTNIGDSAFFGATSLQTISIPNSVTRIGRGAFREATGLASITLPTNPHFTSIGEYAFYGATSLTSITIPNSVTSIGFYALAGASSLQSITIPNSVTSIGPGALEDTSSLTSVTIGTGVLTIGEHAFRGASSLTSITIPSQVTGVSQSTFANMPALTRIEFLGNQPTCEYDYDEGYFVPCSTLFDGSPNATVYRFASATDWPAIGTTYYGHPQAYLVLPPAAPTAVAGNAAATISVTAPSAGPAPTTYTVAAVSDSSKICTITAPATSCIINGLTDGTRYTFTAIANTTSPVASSVTSASSNAVTPTAAVVPPSTSPTTTTTSSSAAAPAVLRLASTRPDSTGSAIVTTFTAPGPGAVHHVGTVTTGRRSTRAATVTVCTYDQTINAAGVVHVTCNLNNTGRRLRTQQALVITLSTTYTPTSGTPMASTKSIRLPRTNVAKAPAQTSTVPSSVTG